MKPNYSPLLKSYVRDLVETVQPASQSRRSLLGAIAQHVAAEYRSREHVDLVFICTHNSRRSHIAQIWATVAAAHFELSGIDCYSGGTEATAFNPNAIAALCRAGFSILGAEGDNPEYLVTFAANRPGIVCFSKVFDDAQNPRADFAAIMTCEDADQNCPLIPNASRFALTYVDPKHSDNTADVQRRYDDCVDQIGAEMFWLMGRVQQLRGGKD